MDTLHSTLQKLKEQMEQLVSSTTYLQKQFEARETQILPRFNGTNPQDWLRKAEKFFAYHNIPSYQRIDQSSRRFESSAWLWFCEIGYEYDDTWDQFKELLVSRFGTATCVEIRSSIGDNSGALEVFEEMPTPAATTEKKELGAFEMFKGILVQGITEMVPNKNEVIGSMEGGQTSSSHHEDFESPAAIIGKNDVFKVFEERPVPLTVFNECDRTSIFQQVEEDAKSIDAGAQFVFTNVLVKNFSTTTMKEQYQMALILALSSLYEIDRYCDYLIHIFEKAYVHDIIINETWDPGGLSHASKFWSSCSLEAERALFDWVSESEWEFKWFFQQEGFLIPLAHQILNFCRFYGTNKGRINFHVTHIPIVDIHMIAKLVFSRNNFLTKQLLLLLKKLQEEGDREDDTTCGVNTMTTILNIYSESSNQFCLQDIDDALCDIYSSMHPSCITFLFYSLLAFDILYSARQDAISYAREWLAVIIKLMNFANCKMTPQPFGKEGHSIVDILCIILYHYANQVLKATTKAILQNTTLVETSDCIVQAACAKSPAKADHGEETSMRECLIIVLLLYYFSLKSLQAMVQESLDWQELLQSSEVKLSSILRISYQRIIKQDEIRYSLGYIESMRVINEGLVLFEDSKLATICNIFLSIMFGWEKVVLLEKRAIGDSKWCRLILEEMTINLAAPSLASKCFSNHHKPAVYIALTLLQLDVALVCMRYVFTISCISRIIGSLSASNATSERVTLFLELMSRKGDLAFDANCERESVVCHYDLHLSAIGCSGSPDKYKCLTHAKQLCSCAWSSRFFMFHYDIIELIMLTDVVRGKLRFLSDSYLGSFWTILIFGFVELSGFILLIVQLRLSQLKPPQGNIMSKEDNCIKFKGFKATIFFIVLYLLALGSGCLKPSMISYQADQFRKDDPNQPKKLFTYFNSAYFSFCVGEPIALTILVWLKIRSGMDVGFRVSTTVMEMGILCLICGVSFYRNKSPQGNIFIPIATCRKAH